MRKGQASLELFFTVSLFILVLFWFNNFVETASAQKQDVLLKQRGALAANVARLANAACILDEEITVRAPCLFNTGKPQSYRLGFEQQSVRVDDVARPTACQLENAAFVVDQCDSLLCVKKTGVKVVVSQGACA